MAVCGAAPASLETLASTYRKTPNLRTRTALLQFANAHPNDQPGALALLALGSTELDQRQFGDALRHLTAARKRLPKLADTIGYLEAFSQSELRDFAAVEPALQPVWRSTPKSPWIMQSVLAQAGAWMQLNQPQKVAPLVQEHLSDLSEQQADLLLARAYEAQGNAAEAAARYLKVYVDHPLTAEASEAETALAHSALPASALLSRALRMIDAGDYTRARKQLDALLPKLTGGELDLARVRAGAAQYLAGEYKPAYQHLISFQASAGEAEAERLYYVLQCARRLDKIDEMAGTLDRLSSSFPQSTWRLQGVIAVANYFSAHNQRDASEPLYRACYQAFPNDPRSEQCHWKYVWANYLRDPAASEVLLLEHQKLYPDSEHASGAMYFLGRIAESKHDSAAARASYEKLTSQYPNYYYAMLARGRLSEMGVAVSKRTSGHSEIFVPTALTKERLERARLLTSAGLDDLAEGELRCGAKADGQPQLMAVELAELANRRDAPDQGIRFIKRYAPAYLSMSMDAAPDKFWRLAFPMPYRSSIETYARAQSLDPYLVAALIRQESEFNPKAISRSNARGLTQVLPGTGRELSRQLKIPRYKTAMLFTPDTNVKIGTFYLKALSDQLQGKWEATLASYNAGKSRAVAWLAAGTYREPAEFVESIPFSETRGYVESVLRNAEVYRRLYSK
ncbi:MAG TPA: transglycosylase SLT domain-containing protein [Bryobacteraceae bacterium]|nr:transglycosylase SLT domain-containing protein [Bryobacteraceae bacterium]